MWNQKQRLKKFDLSKWNLTKSQRATIDNLFAEVEERRREFGSGSYLCNCLGLNIDSADDVFDPDFKSESEVHLTNYANSLIDKVDNKIAKLSCKLSYSTKIDEEGRLWNIEYRH